MLEIILERPELLIIIIPIGLLGLLICLGLIGAIFNPNIRKEISNEKGRCRSNERNFNVDYTLWLGNVENDRVNGRFGER